MGNNMWDGQIMSLASRPHGIHVKSTRNAFVYIYVWSMCFVIKGSRACSKYRLLILEVL